MSIMHVHPDLLFWKETGGAGNRTVRFFKDIRTNLGRSSG